jgi:hypothetical protein
VPSAPDSEPDYRDGRLDGDLPEDPPNERVQWYDTAHAPQGDEEDIDGLTAEALGYLRPGDRDAERIHWELRKRYEGHPVKEGEAGGRSEAPAVLLVMDKGNGIVDAFWFYFYSFNLGNVVLNVRFGNHIGDWEHCLVRFHHGKPKALFFSAHSGGEAYSYDAVEKIGKRVSPHPQNLLRPEANSSSSPSSTLPWARTPCTPPRACTTTSCLGVFSMTRPTAVHSGIRCSTAIRTPTTTTTTLCAPRPPARTPPQSGSTLKATGETSSTRSATIDSTALPDSTIT